MKVSHIQDFSAPNGGRTGTPIQIVPYKSHIYTIVHTNKPHTNHRAQLWVNMYSHTTHIYTRTITLTNNSHIHFRRVL